MNSYITEFEVKNIKTKCAGTISECRQLLQVQNKVF